MVKYEKEFPHLVYKKGNNKELDMIDEAIKLNILKWTKPKGKNFYISKEGAYIYSFFNPTRRTIDAIYLLEQFDHIEIEKDDNKYFACIYTGTITDKEDGCELVYFVEAESFELAVSLAAYESIKYYGDKQEVKKNG